MLLELTELIDKRNRARLELSRAQAALDAFCMAAAITAREASADGSGIQRPPWPKPMPRLVSHFMGEEG